MNGGSLANLIKNLEVWLVLVFPETNLLMIIRTQNFGLTHTLLGRVI